MEFCDLLGDLSRNFVIPIFSKQNLYESVDKVA